MIEVDQTYKLIFNINNAHKIAIDGTLLKTLKNDDKSNLPENSSNCSIDSTIASVLSLADMAISSIDSTIISVLSLSIFQFHRLILYYFLFFL